MGASHAVCYVSDLNYLLPSIASAEGVRRFIPPDDADVFLFTCDVEADIIKALSSRLARIGVTVVPVDTTPFGTMHPEKFEGSTWPVAAMARLFVDPYLPERIRYLSYLDGDTWIPSDPSALLLGAIPDGRFAAVEDMTSYRQNILGGRPWPATATRFRRLGLGRGDWYFNSGVFATSRATWRELSAEAWRYFVENPDVCYAPDQDALNAVMGDRRLRLSIRWNFQTQLRLLGVDAWVQPRICHLVHYPKPWMASCEPWPELFEAYRRTLAPYEDLGLPLRRIGADETRRANEALARKERFLSLPLARQGMISAMGIRRGEREAWM